MTSKIQGPKTMLFDGQDVLGSVSNPVITDPAGVTVQPVSFIAPQHVIVDSGGGGGGSNAAAGLTGAAVPTSASYTGFNSGGNLVGISAATPLPATITNFPASQTISGTVGVSNFPATQTVSGTVAVSSVSSVSGDVAIVNSATLGKTKIAVTADPVTFASPQHTIVDSGSVALTAGSAVIGHVITDSGSVTNATLNAETTKVIGTVNVAAGQTIAVTNTGTFAVQASLAAETTKVIGTVNVASGQTIGLAAGSAVIGHAIVDSGAITATLNAETTKVIGTVNISSGQTVGIAAGSAVIGHVIVDSGAVTATLAAETTKVIGTVNVAASQTIAVTNTGTFATQSTLAAETTKVIGTVNVSAGQTIATTNTGTFAVQATLAAETTKVIGTVNVAAAQTIAVTQATASSLNATVTPPTLTKGTQGATGMSVQALTDAGRNSTTFFTILPVITTATEALLSLTGFKSDVVVTATTTPAVITSGKKYRITNIDVTYVGIATAGSTRISLRKHVAGTVVVTDPVLWQAVVGAPAAVAGVSQTVSFPVDMEINAGDGIGISQLGLSATQTAAAVGYGAVTIYGYEY